MMGRMKEGLGTDPEMRRIKGLLTGLQPGLVAVSGGVDSRFLTALIVRFGLDFRAVFFDGPRMTRREKEQALDFLEKSGIGFDLLPVDPLKEKDVLHNDRQRCYFCKRDLFSRALEHGRKLDRPRVVEGSHLSDRDAYRPGLKALAELGIFSPLAEAGFTKQAIRQQAGRIGLDCPDQPSRPCLLTRFAYGYRPEKKELQQVGRAEDELVGLGLTAFRIRVLGRARILLQLIPAEESLARGFESGIRRVMEHNRLSPFEVVITEKISGFFD
ncbi:MAG: hypothetical protein K9K64_01345 [Desulfohalobiaceae bacterium]|nr:hypothetical protein [Desulfohalobiaceae bacterium]